jgi:hypothetical protein
VERRVPQSLRLVGGETLVALMPPKDLLKRPYEPPALYILEEVEIGSGYHTLHVSHAEKERDWSKPYKKSGSAEYRSRIVRVPYPPAAGK